MNSAAFSNLFVTDFGFFPSVDDITATGAVQSGLHERAAAAARAQFGRAVFVRAVVEISNHCRQQCAYCGMRRDNRQLTRYRAEADALAELIISHRPGCVTDVNIQAGEDPVAVREVAIPLIRRIRRETNLGVSVCLGTLSHELCDALREAGASIYILKFECADAKKYAAYQAPGTLHQRLELIRHLASTGWAVSSGFIAGLPGQTAADLIENLELAASLPLDGCSVSPFIPGEATPLAGNTGANIDWTLNTLAAMRLMRPDWVIPAVSAFNIADHDGYRRALRAGANLATINMTPDDLRGNYVIYKRDRFIMTASRVLDAIEAEGLVPSRLGLAAHYQNGVAGMAAATSA